MVATERARSYAPSTGAFPSGRSPAWLAPDYVAALRDHLGESSRLWGGPHPTCHVEPGYWQMLSNLRAIDYNVVGVHGEEGSLIGRALEEIESARVPALVMVAGPALARVGELIDAGWTCFTASPLMALELPAPGSGRGEPEDAAVRRIATRELAELRGVVTETFELAERLGPICVPDEVALPPGRARHPGSRVRYDAFGLFLEDGLVSAVLTASVGTSACLWAMATPPGRQRQGYGRRLLLAVTARLAEAGSERAVLLSSAAGRRLYGSLGFVVHDHWQVWTKKRWLPAR